MKARVKNKERLYNVIAFVSALVIVIVMVLVAIALGADGDDGVKETSFGIVYKDENGAVVIEQTTTAWTTVKRTTTTRAGERFKLRDNVPLDDWLQGYIYDECYKADIPTSIVYAVIECESNFDENAVSDGGDYGLMQLNEICHEELCERLAVPNVIDPYFNVLAGIALLSDYYHEYDDWNAALMAYNCGKYGAETLFAQGVYTTDYADKVLKMAQKY